MELTDQKVALTLTAATMAFIGAIVLGQFMAERDAKIQAAVEQARHRASCGQTRAFIEITPTGQRWICSGPVTASAELP